MAIITVSHGAFTGGSEIAEKVAANLWKVGSNLDLCT